MDKNLTTFKLTQNDSDACFCGDVSVDRKLPVPGTRGLGIPGYTCDHFVWILRSTTKTEN